MAIVTQKIISKFAQGVALGADITKLAQFKVDGMFDPQKGNGDKVYFSEADGGQLYRGGLDIVTGSGARAAVMGEGSKQLQRGAVGFGVEPVGMTFDLTTEEQTFLITKEEGTDKMAARMQVAINNMAFDSINSKAQAVVCDGTVNGIIDLVGDSLGYLDDSLIEGELCGISNGRNSNAIAKAFAKNGSTNSVKMSDFDLGTAETGALGAKWLKIKGQNSTIVGTDFGDNVTATLGTAETVDGVVMYKTITLSALPANAVAGTRLTPFTIAGCYRTDKLGHALLELATLSGVVENASTRTVTLDHPIIDGEIKVGTLPQPFGWCTLPNAGSAVTGVLAAGASYFQPILLWKKNEVCIGAKALAALPGTDTCTMPAKFAGEKASLPWRGVCWANEGEDIAHWRFDTTFGINAIAGRGVVAMYIPVVASSGS